MCSGGEYSFMFLFYSDEEGRSSPFGQTEVDGTEVDGTDKPAESRIRNLWVQLPAYEGSLLWLICPCVWRKKTLQTIVRALVSSLSLCHSPEMFFNPALCLAVIPDYRADLMSVSAALAFWHARAAVTVPPTWATPPPAGRSSGTRRPVRRQRSGRLPEPTVRVLQLCQGMSLWFREKVTRTFKCRPRVCRLKSTMWVRHKSEWVYFKHVSFFKLTGSCLLFLFNLILAVSLFIFHRGDKLEENLSTVYTVQSTMYYCNCKY